MIYLMYFMPTATPISMELELELESNLISQSSMRIAAFACNSFDENIITNNNAPSCSTTELTHTMLDSTSTGNIKWDLLTLGQNNFFTNNDTISIKLSATAGQSNFQFHSSESKYRYEA